MARRKITQELLENFTAVVDASIDGNAIKEVTKNEVIRLAETFLAENPTDIAPATLAWNTIKDFKVGRGRFTTAKHFNSALVETSFPTLPSNDTPAPAIGALPQTGAGTKKLDVETNQNFVPSIDPNYVADDVYKTINKVLKSNQFFPVYISGPSGIGKTTAAEQACAKLKREVFIPAITTETNEDDLLGGFRLVDGETVWFDGPVVQALNRGGVLVLDEIDLASSKIMCLQGILSGKGVFLKKVNKMIKPAPGFTVIATANTKGQGDDSGKFVGTTDLNEAFLDRFPIALEANYPTDVTETEILRRIWISTGNVVDENAAATIKNLVAWAGMNRQAYMEGLSDDVISTRRLINIVQGLGIFGLKSIKKTLGMVLTRFDEDTKSALVDLYRKIDARFDELEKEETNA